jgi:hypothetical protein
MRDNVNRLRNKSLNYIPSEPNDIPDDLKRDSLGQPFLRYDSGLGSSHRFLLFFSSLKEEYIAKCEFALIDGTFETVPSNFNQLLVIHGYFFGKTYPLFYALLDDKSQPYTLMFLKNVMN